LLFKVGCVWPLPAFAHGFKGRVDLTKGGLGHGGILTPLGKVHQRDTRIANTHGPLEGHALAGPFRERRAIGGDRLLESAVIVVAPFASSCTLIALDLRAATP
jgi:hypothetical protein